MHFLSSYFPLKIKCKFYLRISFFFTNFAADYKLG
jgi:hypothetical protein